MKTKDMASLADEVLRLREGEVGDKVETRMREFDELGRKGNREWLCELSFCILTANSSARLGIDIQEKLGYPGFCELSIDDLTENLKEMGHRFYNKRAEYIVGARRLTGLKRIVEGFSSSRKARDWLVENVKGIGYKEASHFLRNVGFLNVAILDRHILNLSFEHGLISQVPSTLSRKKYLELESKLEVLAEMVDLPLGELDLFLWYMKTKKILK